LERQTGVKSAVVCFGRSSALFDADDFEGLTIAVNRAGLRYRADVWAAGDEPMLRSVSQHVLGRPTWLTAAGTAALARDHGPSWPGEVVEFESLYEYLDPTALPWTMFTATAAIVYAAYRGAQSIDCYGMDWSGQADADGWHDAGNRSDERWTLERGIYCRLADVLRGRGCELRRVTSDH
jgi:hypothetical protein